MPIEWSANYRIGDPEVDAQHEEVFRLARALIEAKSKTDITLCAMRLYKHTREHFQAEEDLMRRINYPDRQEHVEHHNRLISRLNMISEGIGKDNFSSYELEALIHDWALHHVPDDDVRLAAYMKP